MSHSVRYVKFKYYTHNIIFREIRNALKEEKRKTGVSGPKSLHVLLYIINYNIRTWKTFGFYATTSYGCRKEKRQFSTWTSGFSILGWPDVRGRRIKPSLRGRRLHPRVCDHMFILDITAGRPCATRMNLVLADIYIIIYTLYIHIPIYNINTDGGVCRA